METTLNHCKNCNTPLTGEYCHQCGQQDKQSVRSVFAVVGDLFGELGHWDSRFYRTLSGLFLKPGFLSSEFVMGRHASYVPPLRLYFFISLISFMVLTSLIRIDFEQTAENRAQGNSQINSSFEFQDTDLTWLDEEQKTELEVKLHHLQKNPDQFVQKLISMTPQMMLLMLPFWALYLKALYLFTHRYYLEHLTVALHTHAFILLSLMLLTLLESTLDKVSQSLEWQWLTSFGDLLEYMLFGWGIIYLILTQKRFYQQSWPMTLFKFCWCFLGYLFLLLGSFVLMVIIGILNA
ncbi:DUF3667 domain-containing protein [Idiomarina ramblicola]|uniref:DUF3667 domain-containing protein n=1 Tax=Idiomarina ramblicola TaxID=263724 RepID=A0A432Z4W8_9GAMM|nr:DUF3667 domain-containing protein [Idiomarina ramblicola]RUO72944.1 hypothetical protein CWI78_00425 [Idiomarina ramblicola]